MGCSPYFAATRTHPLLPINMAEANYLLPPPTSVLSTTDLIARCAITLQKRCNQLSKLMKADPEDNNVGNSADPLPVTEDSHY
jgi:hypothetical protein